MSGTSGDGVDASIIQSDGDIKFEVILDRYFNYSQEIYESIHDLKGKINNSRDLSSLSKKIKDTEKKITLFHVKAVNETIKEFKSNIDLIGFHGQTIFHNSRERISRQLGDGKLLSELTKKIVIYNFRQNDLKNGGEGAPLTPIFHKLLINKYKLQTPLAILNIGGIANVTFINNDEKMTCRDIGPGNCLIDQWIRLNSKKHYDQDGNLAKSGKKNKHIIEKALQDFKKKQDIKSYDVKDFDLSFVKKMSLEDGAATLTEYTAEILSKNLEKFNKNIIISGGGRKNKFLMKNIEKKINSQLRLIDDFGIDGDFVESQAFAYIAIRSFLNLPISFPETTGVKYPCSGGVISKPR
tara:strand:+ start:208 stop:1266 length:1059 start_codon:yes stop_codon:yes gene_type:complete